MKHESIYMTLPIDIEPDIPTAKGNIYPKELLDKALKKFFKEPQLIGITFASPFDHISLADAACLSEKLVVKDGQYYVYMKILDNEQGSKVLELSRTARLCCSIVGNGTTDDKGIIQEGYSATTCIICRKGLPNPCHIRVVGGHSNKNDVNTFKLYPMMETKPLISLVNIPALEIEEPIELPDFVKALRDYADELDALLGKGK